MKRLSTILFLLLTGLTTVSFGAITGRVVSSLAPLTTIPNTTVSLKINGGIAFTDSAGRFSLAGSTEILRANAIRPYAMNIIGTTLNFFAEARENVRIDLYDVRGQRVSTILNKPYEAGNHAVSLGNLLPKTIGAGLYILDIHKGKEQLVHALVPLSTKTISGFSQSSFAGAENKAKLAKRAAATDSLIVYRMGYIPKAIDLTSLTTQDMGDIVLTLTPEEVSVARKVDSLLALMTLNQKAGQMCESQINTLSDAQVASLGVGSVFNGGEEPVSPNNPATWATRLDQLQTTVLTSSTLKIPVIYGIDAVHGNAKVAGCTVFPHNIGMGCTHDTSLAAAEGAITAAECAAVGIHLTFATAVSVARNERWGRTYEGFGETPEINAMMGAAYVRGLQGYGDMSKSSAISSCVKHYLGDGGTTNGANGGTTSLSDSSMRAIHLPPYAACARENMGAVMPSYNTWARSSGSFKQSIDSYSLTTILKNQLGFDGFYLSDYDAIPQACGQYSNSCVAQSINAGMDMSMTVGSSNPATYINAIVADVNSGTIPLARVNDAVKRILRTKFRMHLFDHPKSDTALRSQIFSAAHRAVARSCVRKSLVLLKNESAALPLLKSEKIVVVGPWANTMGAQCGGWTIGWQGSTSYTNIAGQTILAGLQSLGTNVTSDPQGNALTTADKIVVVVGENPYAEGNGDVAVPDFTNCPNSALIQKCFNSGKPVILVMITGRPMLIDTEMGWCKAIVSAWLPGSEGGGIADVLFGDYNFSGTLTHTWPASSAQIPINAGPTYADEQHGTGGTPLYPYGYGLKY